MKATAGSRSLSVAEVREQLADMLNEVKYAKKRTVVTKHGREVAAVVSVEDLQLLERIEDFIDVATALERLTNNPQPPMDWDDALKELEASDDLQDTNRHARDARVEKGARKGNE